MRAPTCARLGGGTMNIKVILADDHQILREALRALLAKEPDITVVGEAGNGRQSVQLARTLHPDVVVMDVAMPDMNGIDATRKITSVAPGTRVIALSMHSDKRFVKEMLRAGASGYLLKDCAMEELVLAIHAVMAKKVYFSPAIAGIVADEFVRRSEDADASPLAALSPREREVLQLLAEGHGAREIAGMIGVSVKTVETHRQHIMDKLDIHSIAELTKCAVREGLTRLDF